MSFEERARDESRVFCGNRPEASFGRISFEAGANWGHAYAECEMKEKLEHELRAPGPCGIKGHTNADWHPCDHDVQGGTCGCGIQGHFLGYCAACKRERELREALRILSKGAEENDFVLLDQGTEMAKPLLAKEVGA